LVEYRLIDHRKKNDTYRIIYHQFLALRQHKLSLSLKLSLSPCCLSLKQPFSTVTNIIGNCFIVIVIIVIVVVIVVIVVVVIVIVVIVIVIVIIGIVVVGIVVVIVVVIVDIVIIVIIVVIAVVIIVI